MNILCFVVEVYYRFRCVSSYSEIVISNDRRYIFISTAYGTFDLA